MAKVPAAKKRKAFRLRLEGMPITRVARECKLAPQTVRRLENGYTDKMGVRRPGWREELEKLWHEQERAELESGLALKKERIKTYERLASEAVGLIEKQFPKITMKSCSDAKALLSEVRELCRLISIERGEYRPKGGAQVGVKVDISPEELRERYLAAQAVEVVEVEPPQEAHMVPGPDEEDEADALDDDAEA